MIPFEIYDIPAREDHATKMKQIRRQDMFAMDMSLEYIDLYTDPNNPDLIDTQLGLLRGEEEYKKRRIGAFAVDGAREIIAFIITGEWRAGDERAVTPKTLEALGLLALEKTGNHLPSRPDGIFSLVADREQDIARQELALSQLLSLAIDAADERGKEIRMNFYENDPASELLFNNGFEIVEGKIGRPIGDVDQKLIVRKPRVLASDDIL